MSFLNELLNSLAVEFGNTHACSEEQIEKIEKYLGVKFEEIPHYNSHMLVFQENIQCDQKFQFSVDIENHSICLRGMKYLSNKSLCEILEFSENLIKKEEEPQEFLFT